MKPLFTVLLPLTTAFTAAAGTSLPQPGTAAADSIYAVRCIELAVDTAQLHTGDVWGDRALHWLYAYMPAVDAAGTDPAVFIDAVQATREAIENMPWGPNLPERELRHFVLPLRVNNEAIDNHRPVLWQELRSRVEGMDMKEAILEVNHWCHEKVSYRPSDARTSPPLSAVSQAIGRCGEESTLAVAALRSVGIPARQVYTPRWAHTDDNHAWVEAWADGEWHFIGACEPEPVLDLAWFNAPAARGLMMTTTVMGDYDGPEEVLRRNPYRTEINVTSNYAPTGEATVTVTDSGGNPLAGVDVDFCIYNYASLYRVVTRRTDSQGRASLLTGLGQSVAWATDGQAWNYATVSPGEKAVIILDSTDKHRQAVEYTVTPPAGVVHIPQPDAMQRTANNRRLAYEDSLRNSYIATFFDVSDAEALGRELDCDPTRLAKLLTASRGNHGRLTAWLRSNKTATTQRALALLESLTEKDLRDVGTAVLTDCMAGWREAEQSPYSEAEYAAYVLSPRISTEPLTPWRSKWQQRLGSAACDSLQSDPAYVTRWIDANMRTDNGQSMARSQLTDPAAALGGGYADAMSRPLLAVALLRAAGVASRLDPVTGTPQFLSGARWHDLDLQPQDNRPVQYGTFSPVFSYKANGIITEPKYYSHFTLSRIEEGRPEPLEYGDFTTVAQINAAPGVLPAGEYLLTSGQRMADGSVAVRMQALQLDKENFLVEFELPCNDEAIQVRGSFDSETIYRDLASDSRKSLLAATGRGYYTLVMVEPSHEPTAHVLNDIAVLAGEFEADGRKIVCLFADSDAAARFDRTAYASMPANTVWGVDEDGTVSQALQDEFGLAPAQNPRLIVADTFNRVVHTAAGYTIGTGERLLNLLKRLGK